MSITQKKGIVISTKMQKTIVIKVENQYSHKLYSKIINKTKKYLVHDELEQCLIGDYVLIEQCRPISKKKHWKLINIFSK